MTRPAKLAKKGTLYDARCEGQWATGTSGGNAGSCGAGEGDLTGLSLVEYLHMTGAGKPLWYIPSEASSHAYGAYVKRGMLGSLWGEQ